MTPADLAPFRATFIRALGACAPKPTLCRFDPGVGLTIVLRDAARSEVTVRILPDEGVVVGDVPPSHAAWIDVIRAAVTELDASPAWVTALRR